MQSFVSGSSTNFGWMIRDDTEGSATTRHRDVLLEERRQRRPRSPADRDVLDMSVSVPFEETHPAVRPARVKTTAPGRRRRIGNLLFVGVVVAAGILWAAELRPERLGGTTDYVMVQGVSMLPTYRSGDLVLVRPAAGYGVGDIVAYRVPAGEVGAGLTVIHRIVGGSAARGFITKGDNNADVDDWHPKGSDVEGAPWFVPETGRPGPGVPRRTGATGRAGRVDRGDGVQL